MTDICANTKSFTYHIISRGREKEKEKEGKRENKEKTYASNRASTNCRSLQAQQHQSPRDYNAAHKHVNEVTLDMHTEDMKMTYTTSLTSCQTKQFACQE